MESLRRDSHHDSVRFNKSCVAKLDAISQEMVCSQLILATKAELLKFLDNSLPEDLNDLESPADHILSSLSLRQGTFFDLISTESTLKAFKEQVSEINHHSSTAHVLHKRKNNLLLF